MKRSTKEVFLTPHNTEWCETDINKCLIKRFLEIPNPICICGSACSHFLKTSIVRTLGYRRKNRRKPKRRKI